MVLGVLIALGLGEIADTLRWQVRAGQAEQAVRQELSLNLGILDERGATQACLTRRIEALGAVLATARRTGVLPDIGPIGHSPLRPMPLSAWAMATGGEFTLHMRRDAVARLSQTYAALARLPEGTNDESTKWSKMTAVEHAPGAVDPGPLGTLILVQRDLKILSRINGVTAMQLAHDLRKDGVKADYSIVTERPEQGLAWLRASYAGQAICRPLVVDGKPFVPPEG